MEYIGVILGLVAIAIIQLAACAGSVVLFLRMLPLAQDFKSLQGQFLSLKEGPAERKAQLEKLTDEVKDLRRDLDKLDAAQHAERGRYGQVLRRLRIIEAGGDEPDDTDEVPLDLSSLVPEQGRPPAPPVPPRKTSFGKTAI